MLLYVLCTWTCPPLCPGSLKEFLAEDYKNVVFSCLSGAHFDVDNVEDSVNCVGTTVHINLDQATRIQTDPVMVSCSLMYK